MPKKPIKSRKRQIDVDSDEGSDTISQLSDDDNSSVLTESVDNAESESEDAELDSDDAESESEDAESGSAKLSSSEDDEDEDLDYSSTDIDTDADTDTNLQPTICHYPKDDDRDTRHDTLTDISDPIVRHEYLTGDDRITKDILTKYEKTTVLGIRIDQLYSGAASLIPNASQLKPEVVAHRELQEGVMPLFIIRKLANNKMEKWKVNELRILK